MVTEEFEYVGRRPWRMAILAEFEEDECKRNKADQLATKLRAQHGREVVCSKVRKSNGQTVYRIFIPMWRQYK